MIREPKTDPIPAPDPATPTVAAPAPMNLAAESMSLEVVVVWKLRVRGATAMGRATTWLLTATVLAAGRASLAAYRLQTTPTHQTLLSRLLTVLLGCLLV